jgi:hypothetical protein
MELFEHYKNTGRTPLSMGEFPKYSHHDLVKMKNTWDKRYNDFITLLNHTEGNERKELINKGIGTFERIKKHNSDYEVIAYFDRFISELKDMETEPLKDWMPLYNNLINNYFKDVTLYDFNEIMNFRRLPDGKNPIKWNKAKGYCLLLFRSYGFKTAEIKRIFEGNFHDNQLKGIKPTQNFIELCFSAAKVDEILKRA